MATKKAKKRAVSGSEGIAAKYDDAKPTPRVKRERIPVYDRIIVKRKTEVESMAGGLYLPQTSQEQQQEGEVLAVGDGRYDNGILRPLTVKVGHDVVFGKYAGTEIKIDGEDLLILREEEVLFILR
jgi:chaperonin GroES